MSDRTRARAHRRRVIGVALGVTLAAATALAIAVSATPLARTAPNTDGAAAADRLVLRGGLLVDALHPNPRAVDLVLSSGRVEAVADPGSIEVRKTDHVLDLDGAFVAPGLVDGHAHMLRAGYCSGDEGVSWSNLQQIPLNFDVALDAGLTTVVDLGGPLHGVVAVRDALAASDGYAPRYLVAGPMLTAAGGYPMDWAPPEVVDQLGVVIELSDVPSARAAIRRVAEAGVDLVKVAWMDVAYNDKPLPTLAPEVFRAAVDEAHAHKLRVFVHAHTAAGYRAALDAGADVIAHSAFDRLPDDIVTEVAAREVPVIPTLWVFASFAHVDAHPEHLEALRAQIVPPLYDTVTDYARRARAADDELPPDFLPGIRKTRVDEAMRVARENLRRLADAGAVIAFGTDTSFCFAQHGAVVYELEEMRRAGLSASQAFAAATVGSAAALARPDLGLVAAGGPADLLVLDANPLTDLQAFARPRHVIAAGRLVPDLPRDEPPVPGFFRTLKVVAELLPALLFN